jgi:hypothetical protein
MTTTPSRTAVRKDPNPYAVGASLFAAIVLVMVGVLQVLQGLVTLVDGTDFLVRTPHYVFELNATTWGWIHVVIGVVMAVAGCFIFVGNAVARGAGIGIAAISAIVNFLWLPYYPLWSVLIIAIDVVVIWGLATVRIDPVDM